MNNVEDEIGNRVKDVKSDLARSLFSTTRGVALQNMSKHLPVLRYASHPFESA